MNDKEFLNSVVGEIVKVPARPSELPPAPVDNKKRSKRV